MRGFDDRPPCLDLGLLRDAEGLAAQLRRQAPRTIGAADCQTILNLDTAQPIKLQVIISKLPNFAQNIS